MNDELKKLKEDIAKAQEQLRVAVMNNLMSVVKTSEKKSAYGKKYINVDIFDYKILELRDSELIFVDENLNTYSIDNGDCSLDDFMDIIRIEDERREKDKREVRLKKQYELAQEVVRRSGISIVTCGNCGDVNLHRVDDDEITCASCGFESEPCEFPDLFY
jgi:hypothetical protein